MSNNEHPTFSMIRPDDWHVHLRDGEILKTVAKHTASVFARAIVMPNLKPPVTTVEMAVAYRQRILAAVPDQLSFEPLMTLYLTDNLSIAEVDHAADSPIVHAIKYYPAGATTNSDAGVTDLNKVMPALAHMAKRGLPLLVHGEITDPSVDVFDREARFIDDVLVPLVSEIPQLKVVLEHITTREAVDFVRGQGEHIAATITPQHMLYNRNALFTGGIRPHYYCLPVLKRESHRAAIFEAATSGETSFFLGTDSAPHTRHSKESSCGCAGIYSAPVALAFYAQAFDAVGALDRLEAFASLNGPRFYGLPVNNQTITLEKKPWTIPPAYASKEGDIVPMASGFELQWQ